MARGAVSAVAAASGDTPSRPTRYSARAFTSAAEAHLKRMRSAIARRLSSSVHSSVRSASSTPETRRASSACANRPSTILVTSLIAPFIAAAICFRRFGGTNASALPAGDDDLLEDRAAPAGDPLDLQRFAGAVRVVGRGEHGEG